MTNQVTITRNSNNQIVLNDNGREHVLEMRVNKQGVEWYALPENSSGWKTIQESTLKRANYELTLEHKAPRAAATTPKTPKAPKTSSIREFLTPTEQLTYDALVERARIAQQIAALRAQIEADKAKLAELEAAASDNEDTLDDLLGID